MLHILFLILLILLGIICIFLGVVLFLPIRYELRAKAKSGWDDLKVELNISWCLRLLSAVFKYEDKKTYTNVRFAWKKIDFANKKKKKEKNKKSKCTIKKLYDKIKTIFIMKDKAVDFLTDETHLLAFGKVKSELTILLRVIRPHKMKGYVRFGFEDPYHTGQALAVLSILYPFYSEHIEIYPVFDEKILEGDISMKGKIRSVRFLSFIMKLVFFKHVQTTYKDFKSFKIKEE